MMIAFVLACCTLQQAYAAGYGHPGDPLRLTVGYQPYYTQAWSAVILRQKAFYSRYIPDRVKVRFYVGLRGLVLLDALRKDRIQMAYMGDLPAVLGASDKSGDLAILAAPSTSAVQCGILLVRKDAPQFSAPGDVLKWLSGRTIAVAKGSCSESFLHTLVRSGDLHPSHIYNQSPDAVTAGFHIGKLDAAVVWQPEAARLVRQGDARIAATGADFGWSDGAYLVVRRDFLDARPDVVRAWLHGELDAERFLSDTKNAKSILRAAAEQTSGYSKDALRDALYRWPDPFTAQGNTLEFDFTLAGRAQRILQSTWSLLHDEGRVSAPLTLAPELSKEVIEAAGLTSPVGHVHGTHPTKH